MVRPNPLGRLRGNYQINHIHDAELATITSANWRSFRTVEPSPHRNRFYPGTLIEIPMKPHILNSDEGLISGKDQEAVCGEIVRNAEFKWDSDGANELFLQLPLRTCRKCLAKDLTKRYIYVAVPGQEARVTNG